MSQSSSEIKIENRNYERHEVETGRTPDTEDILYNENKWKRRLDSLRRSLARRRIPTEDEPGYSSQKSEKKSETDVFKNGYLSTKSQVDCHSSHDINDCSTSTSKETSVAAAKTKSSRVPQKKRKRFARRKRRHSIKKDIVSGAAEAQDKNDVHYNSTVANHAGASNAKQSDRNKSMLTLPSWFKTLGRSSGKNDRLQSQRKLSVSTGNFTVRDNNFKLLRDVKLVRDPGYVSSSADSLDRNDTDDDRYNSLRRSRASLIDIRRQRTSRSETNLNNSRSLAFRNSFKTTTSVGEDKHESNQTNVVVNNYPYIQTQQVCEKTSSLRSKNGPSTESASVDCQNSVAPVTQRSIAKVARLGNIVDEDDTYLTAEEEEGCKRNINTPVDVRNNSFGLRKFSCVTLPATTRKRKPLSNTLSCDRYKETRTDFTSPLFDTNSPKARLSQSQPAITSNYFTSPTTEPALQFGLLSLEENHSNGGTKDGDHVADSEEHCPPLFYNPQAKIASPTDGYCDVVFTRPPQQPAPKPPVHIKHRSQSLTTLGAALPTLTEQLHLNEASSVHKLNDSCGDNLCELVSQSKNRSRSNEGLYVGIVGDQGVILRKNRMLPNPKRGFSMPSELLENVQEVDDKEGSDWSITYGSNMSEINGGQSTAIARSCESEVFFSCTSKSPSPVTCAETAGKETCMRSLSISSIEVQDLNQHKRVLSKSVPCLTRQCSAKSPVDNRTTREDGCPTAQSMIALDQGIKKDDQTDAEEKAFGKPLLYAEALWDHVTMNEGQLCFTAGQAIAVYDIHDIEWWFGLVDDHIGWFPASFVRIPVSEDLWNKYQHSVGENVNINYHVVTREMTESSCLSRAEIRERIVEEIKKSEVDYVKNLRNIVDGYLKQAKRRPDMFSDELLKVLFSNIEDIYYFHLDFLQRVRDTDERKEISVGQIGKSFVQNKHQFSLYAEYCNNHPRASQELKNLLQQDKYRYFFEACRLLQEMIRISLDGFLLTPVQKICKYPLQLQELLKYTDSEHSDYENVEKALETMREVASGINEEKRKADNIKKIAEWQLTVQQWVGEDVLVKSSQLVHSGEVTKISKGKSQDVTLFLFDHQLIYCKKDVLKKHSLDFKGRIVLDNYKFEKLEDGEVSHNGAQVINAWRLSNKQSNTTCLFQARTPEQRDKWLKYFIKERQIVYQSTSKNVIPAAERLAAMDSAKNILQNDKPKVKREKKYGNFNTVGRVTGRHHYADMSKQRKVDLPPPVSSAMLFERGRPEIGTRRNSGIFKKKSGGSKNDSR